MVIADKYVEQVQIQGKIILALTVSELSGKLNKFTGFCATTSSDKFERFALIW